MPVISAHCLQIRYKLSFQVLEGGGLSFVTTFAGADTVRFYMFKCFQELVLVLRIKKVQLSPPVVTTGCIEACVVCEGQTGRLHERLSVVILKLKCE